MALEWLKTILGEAYTEDTEKKISAEIGKGFVAREEFNTTRAELKQAKDALAERDGQLETLKASKGDVEALKKEIGELQEANKTQGETHVAEIQKLKIDAAVNSALLSAKAHNPDTVKPLLTDYLAKAEFDGEKLKGLDTAIKKLTESEETRFLFAAEEKPTFKGMVPGEGGGGPTETDPFLSGFNNN